MLHKIRVGLTDIVLVNFLGEIELGHPVLVDLDLVGFTFCVVLSIAKSEQILLGLAHIRIWRKLNAGVSFLFLLGGSSRVVAWALRPLLLEARACSTRGGGSCRRASPATRGRLAWTTARTGRASWSRASRGTASVRHDADEVIYDIWVSKGTRRLIDVSK